MEIHDYQKVYEKLKNGEDVVPVSREEALNLVLINNLKNISGSFSDGVADKETLNTVKMLLENMRSTQVVSLDAVGEINKFIKKELASLVVNFKRMPAVVYNDEIHLLGNYYIDSGQHQGIRSKYNGTKWTKIGQFSDDLGFYIGPHHAVVYNDDIYYLGSDNSSNAVVDTLYSIKQGAITSLPYKQGYSRGNFIGMVVYNNEIHLLGNVKYYGCFDHYKYDGTSWIKLSTLPTNFVQGTAVVYNDEIHIFCRYNHYKYNGTRWIEVSTLPYEINTDDDAVIYKNEIHIFYNTQRLHYKLDGTSWVESSGSGIPGCRIIVYKDEIYSIGGQASLESFYKLADVIYKQQPTLHLLKDTKIYSPCELTDISNCTLDTDHLVVTEDGNVSFGVLTEDTKSLITLC